MGKRYEFGPASPSAVIELYDTPMTCFDTLPVPPSEDEKTAEAVYEALPGDD